MEIRPLSAPERAAWDRFCHESPDAWFWHTTAWLDYTLAYRPDLRSRSLAFTVTAGRRGLAVVPLVAETHASNGGEVVEFSFGGDALWTPALTPGLEPEERGRVLDFILEHVDRLARNEGAGRATWRLTPLAPAFAARVLEWLMALQRAGYQDVSQATLVVDLSSSVEALWQGLRRNHRRSLKRADSMTVEVYHQERRDDDAFEAYRAMHRKAAGRVTRPAETFDLMKAWVRAGHAALFAAREGDRDLGFVYVLTYRDAAYFASAANDPEVGRRPVGHLLHWTAIQWLKARGYRACELGLQHFAPLPHDVPTEKDLGIALFKLGFGGATVPAFRREKFYSPDLYAQVTARRAERYRAALTAWVGEDREEEGTA